MIYTVQEALLARIQVLEKALRDQLPCNPIECHWAPTKLCKDYTVRKNFSI